MVNLNITKDWTEAEKHVYRFYATYNRRSYSSLYYYWRIENAIFNLFDGELLKFSKNEKIKILDLGCQIGAMLFELVRRHKKDYQLDFSGIDISPDFIKIAKRLQQGLDLNCSFLEADLEKDIKDIKNDTFDIIICNQLLEHLVNQKKAIDEIKRMLKPEGLVIIGVPNKGALHYRVLKFMDKSFFKNNFKKIFYNGLNNEEILLEYDYGYGHISERTYLGWKNLFKEAGLTIESVKTTALFWSSHFFDRHPLISACGIVFDSLIKPMPFRCPWSSNLVFGLRK